ncbi:MAG: iron ABC transporter permease [Chloroflexi bacterium]|nr:iron ABC transporter permease [Chloroflexota bacterium]
MIATPFAAARARILRARRTRPPLSLLAIAAAICVLALVPVVYLVLRATSADDQVLQVLLRPRMVYLLGTSLLVALSTVAGSVALGVPLAWLTCRTDLPGRRVWTVLVVAPLAVPSYILAYALVAAIGPGGAVRDAMQQLSLGWLVPAPFGLPGAVLVLVLSTYPLVLLSARAALLRTDPAITETARSLGDGPMRAFVRSTLPTLMPAIATGALLAALYALSDFGSVSILRADTFARAIQSQYSSSIDRQGAALLSLVLVLVALALILAEARLRRHASIVTPHGARRAPQAVALGRWRWPALALCGAVVAVALVLPAAVVGVWVVRGMALGTVQVDVLAATRGSLSIAIPVAALAIVLAVPVAMLQVGYPGRFSRATRAITLTAYAIPGISFALAVVFASLALVPDLYRTLPILVLAMAIRYLPLAVSPTAGTMMLVGGGLVEAARSLGDSPARAARTILLPLVRPGIIAVVVLVFLSAIKELPLTLFLAPPGVRTLETRVWTDATEGAYVEAAGPAMVLLVVSLASVGLLVREPRARTS